MSRMADGEELITSVTEIDVALKSAPGLKKNEPPKVPPKIPHGDTMLKGKGCEQQLQGDTHSQLNGKANVDSSGALQNTNPEMVSVEQKEGPNTPVILRIGGDAVAAEKVTVTEVLKKINPDMVLLRIRYLRNLPQVRRKGVSVAYNQNVEAFIAKLEVFSLDEILSKEMDLVFLQKLLDHILDIPDTEKVIMSPLTNSLTSSDPLLEALAAAPSCYHRANAELPAPIPDDISRECLVQSW